MSTTVLERESRADISPLPRWVQQWLPDALGVLWTAAAGVALLVPALTHGLSLGPFDLLSTTGLSAKSGVLVHNSASFDQIAAFNPWTNLAWSQVHHGQLPLWNPYSGLGMPLAFNWQSAPFGVPAMVGYLFPVRLAYTAGVIATVVIAGIGAYLFGRVLHLGVIACAFAGTVFELSGPIAGWLGWPLSSVMSWSGWLFAAAILILRGRHRPRFIVLFALVFACAVYAGDPEILLYLILSLVLFVAVVLALRAKKPRSPGVASSLMDLFIAGAAGSMLAAPLALPGFQFIRTSSRSSVIPHGETLPLHDLIHVLLQGFDGLPIAGGQLFTANFYETNAYLGVIAVVFAFTGIARGRRRPEVIALTAIAVVTAAIVFLPGIVTLLDQLPAIGSVHWNRALMPMAFSVAMLAGFGIDALTHSKVERATWYWVGGGFTAAALVLVVLWVVARGQLLPAQASARAQSFAWPFIATVVGLVVVGAWFSLHQTANPRRTPAAGWRFVANHWPAATFLVVETGLLLAAGAPLWSSSPSIPTPTRAEATLQRAVGPALVGFGGGDCQFGPVFRSLGIVPNVNVLYRIRELAIYDPAVPNVYYTSWRKTTGVSAAEPFPLAYLYCPKVTTASLARLYGVSYVLEPIGASGPTGGVFKIRVGNEDLYRIPRSSMATLTPTKAGVLPRNGAVGRPLRLTYQNGSSVELSTASPTAQVLRVHIANVPGWHATIDGKPLALLPYAGVMLQARIPPGHHAISLRYWPNTFSIGILLAVLSAIGLSVAVLLTEWARRRQHRFK